MQRLGGRSVVCAVALLQCVALAGVMNLYPCDPAEGLPHLSHSVDSIESRQGPSVPATGNTTETTPHCGCPCHLSLGFLKCRSDAVVYHTHAIPLSHSQDFLLSKELPSVFRPPRALA